MRAIKTKEQRARDNQFMQCRLYIKAKRFDKAEEYAKFRGFTVADVRAKSRFRLPEPKKEPAPVAKPEPAAQSIPEMGAILVSEPKAEAMLNGWPLETDAIVWRGCRNRRLVVLQLPDGREASMWRGQKTNWRLGSQVRVVLESASGDPYYYQKEI